MTGFMSPGGSQPSGSTELLSLLVVHFHHRWFSLQDVLIPTGCPFVLLLGGVLGTRAQCKPLFFVRGAWPKPLSQGMGQHDC